MENPWLNNVTKLSKRIKNLMQKDREILVKGERAFVAFIRAYSDHECSFIFQLRNLDCGAIANGLGLLYVCLCSLFALKFYGLLYVL